MRIIDTIRGKSKVLALFTFTLYLLALQIGCISSVNLRQAKDYARLSQDYYQRAIADYKALIKNGRDLDRLYFELGSLYYSHGDFLLAQENFQKADFTPARKFLAISYYRLGRFSEALDVFAKITVPDDEYLYYYGLTSEELNLYDQALGLYKKIQSSEFASSALERINTIEKQGATANIKDLSPQINKILNEAPSQEEYPQAGALILFCDERIEVTLQNSQVSSAHYLVKILNERGKKDFSETQIEYDSTYERVELEFARTIKPDGTVVEIGSRHIRDVSQYLNFPLYSNARVFIISFPEITEGASIEYKIKVYRSQLINKKDFALGYALQAGEPLISANFSISVPQDRVLKLKNINEEYNNFGALLDPRIEKDGQRIIYSWQFKNVPQILPEPSMPASVQINPTVLISTFRSWQEIHDWWWSLSKDKIKSDATIKSKVQELIAAKASEEERVRQIYNFCTKDIRYVAVEYGQAGYEPHPAADIFRNKYGDCKDQAILLITMLKEAGFKAWPVLIGTKGYYNLNADFPAFFFNHAICAVSLGDRVVFLDPTAETCSFGDLPGGDQARRVLIFKDAGYEIQETPVYPAAHNFVKEKLAIKINNDETIAAQKAVFTGGIYEQGQRQWLLYTPPQLIEEALKEKIQGISIGAKLDNYDIKNANDLNLPVLLSYSFSGPEYLTLAGPLRIMPQLASIDTSIVAKEKRRYPIEFSIQDSRETVFEFEIGDSFGLNYLPESISEESPWMEFQTEYSRKDKLIYVKQKVELKKDSVGQEEYPVFKAFFEGLAKKIKQRIVLEKAK